MPRPTPWPEPVTMITRPSTECMARIAAVLRRAAASSHVFVSMTETVRRR